MAAEEEEEGGEEEDSIGSNVVFTDDEAEQPKNQVDRVYSRGERSLYRALCEELKHVKRFGYVGRRCGIRLEPYEGNMSAIEWFQNVLHQILNGMRDRLSVGEDEFVGLEISNTSNPEKTIGIPFRKNSQFHTEKVSHAINNAAQSNETFLTEGDILINFDVFKQRIGMGVGIRTNAASNFEEICRRKNSVVVINNINDKLCLLRAVCVCLSKLNDTEEVYNHVRDSRRAEQYMRALKLSANAKLDLRNGVDIKSIENLQEYLKDYKITVFEDFTGRNIWFEGPESSNENLRRYVDLIYDVESQHFNSLTNITGCFFKKYYCRQCRLSYNARGFHPCAKMCNACKSIPECPKTPRYVECDRCNRLFYDIAKKTYELRSNDVGHKCFQVYCRPCGKLKDRNHQCYMSIAKPYKPLKFQKVLYIFFDIETDQATPVPGHLHTYLQKPILIVAQQSCYQCSHVVEHNYLCHHCGMRENVFL
ncbi:hypothetical protein B566_EDAN017670 [Ephemera danica]|nr:hypothetical protein B566_EDAN017670 [Ephemera danica]